MKDAEPVTFPYQQLYLIGTTVNEDIYLVIQRILMHLISYYSAQPLEGAPQVGIPHKQEILNMIM
jgi:hypothetical protein